MANLKPLISKVEKTVTEDKVTGVILELSLAEAEVLRTILYRHVCGPMRGKRHLMDDVQRALSLGGIPCVDLHPEGERYKSVYL